MARALAVSSEMFAVRLSARDRMEYEVAESGAEWLSALVIERDDAKTDGAEQKVRMTSMQPR